MNKQPIVCMTGFTDDPQSSEYIAMLSKLNCKYIKELLMGVDYLIVRNTCTEKFKIAELAKSQVQCLTIDWIKDSHAKGRILPIDKYRVPHVFYGVRVGIYGYSDSEASKIITVLKNNGVELAINININGGALSKVAADPKSGKNGKDELQLTVSLLQSLDVIVATPRQLLKLTDVVPHTPIVSVEWIEESVRARICKFPIDYAMNYLTLRGPPSNSQYKRLHKKMKNYFQLDFIQERAPRDTTNLLTHDSNMTSHCIIHLEPNSIDHQLAILLKKIICLTGGLYMDVNNLSVTHVLVGAITQNQYLNFMKNGDHIYVLRVEWLIDSLLFSQRLPEKDYKIRSFKGSSIQSSQYLTEHSQFSQTYQNGRFQASMGANTLPMGASSRKNGKSISMVRQVTPKVVKKPVSKTDIFKGKYFYLDKKQRRDELAMKNIVQKISENGGNPIEVLPPTNKTVYVILADSEENPQLLKDLTSSGSHVELIPMSTRWIDHCIKKNEFFHHKTSADHNFFIFKPLSFPTPLKQFRSMKIQILGINDLLKFRFRQLISTLGSCKVSPNKSQITHCLCGKDYKVGTRYQELLRENPSIKFVRAQWLLDISNDATTKIENYYIPPPQSQNIEPN